MENQDEENLKELFGKFMSSEHAGELAEDVPKVERIFQENPAPEPESALIADINERIVRALQQRKVSSFRRMVYKAAAVAATVIIITAAGIMFFGRRGDEVGRIAAKPTILSSTVWENEDVSADDTDLATLVAEVEQSELDVHSLRFGEGGGNGYTQFAELETELMEINSDFWKG